MKKNNFLDKFKKVIWILTPFILITIIFMLLLRCCSTQNIYSLEKNKNIIDVGVVRTKKFNEPLNTTFPTSFRKISNSNMFKCSRIFKNYL